ncbi:MAG: HD domain-containing phosphohydrolase [Pseudomonadota bacterium]
MESKQRTAMDSPPSWYDDLHQQWVATLDAVSDAIIVVDSGGLLLRVNRKFSELADAPILSLVGKRLGDVAPWLTDGGAGVSVLPVTSALGRIVQPRRCDTDSRLYGAVYILEDVTPENAIAAAEAELVRNSGISVSDTVHTLLQTLALTDPYTSNHSRSVAVLSRRLAQSLGYDALWSHHVYLGALIHDIGKISVPISILNRPGRLANAEMNLIKLHPDTGYTLIRDLNLPDVIGEIVLQHHERLDGTGYPRGLKGDAIGSAARIVGVADVVEAICAHRPYRPALDVDVARETITKGRGSHFDERVVDACLDLIEDGLDFATQGNGLGCA